MVPEGRESNEERAGAHREAVRAAFGKQAEEFSRSPVMTDRDALEKLVAWSQLTDLDVSVAKNGIVQVVETLVQLDVSLAQMLGYPVRGHGANGRGFSARVDFRVPV